MDEFEFGEELKEIAKLIEQSKINPDDIRQMFKEDYGTKIDISWLDKMSVPGDPEPKYTKDIGIIHSMRLAANELVDKVDTYVEADFMYPAIMFCYMHYLELALKTVAARNNSYYDGIDATKVINLDNIRESGHDIDDIWSRVKDTVNTELKLNSNEFSCLNTIMDCITGLNKTSMAYRFASRKNGTEYFDNSQFGVDLKIVCIFVNLLDEYLNPLYEENWKISKN